MEYILKTNSLEKRYRDFSALKGLTMSVPKGAIYGFVGKNGAGKTTLIRLICGLQKESAGEYELFGVKNTDREICRARRRMGAIGMSFHPDRAGRGENDGSKRRA